MSDDTRRILIRTGGGGVLDFISVEQEVYSFVLFFSTVFKLCHPTDVVLMGGI